jgi:hypothetical protein
MPYTTIPPAAADPPVLAYRHAQPVPSAQWIIVHNLGFRPSGVLVTDAGGNEVEGAVAHLDPTTTTITFGLPVSGIADLS